MGVGTNGIMGLDRYVMPVSNQRRARLSIDVTPELRRRLKVAAATRELSVREYVEAILRQVLEAEERGEMPAERAAWSRLSARSFARDWESAEDQAYDGLASCLISPASSPYCHPSISGQETPSWLRIVMTWARCSVAWLIA